MWTRVGFDALIMKTAPHLVSDTIELMRRPVHVCPDRMYKEIGIRSFGKGIFHKPAVLGSELGSKRVFSIAPGDLIFSNVFAWEGAVALASADDAGLVGSHRFMTYQVDNEIADARYLYYYFISERGLDIIRRSSPGSAGRNKTLGIKNFASQIINLPGLSDQRRVAGILDEAFEKAGQVRELRQRAARLKDALPQSLLEHLLRGTAIEHRRLGEVLGIERIPIAIEPEELYTQIGIRSFGRGIFHYDAVPGANLSKLRYFKVHPGRLIVSNIMAWEGAVAVSTENDNGCVGSNRFLSYVPLTKIDLNYVNCFFQSKLGRMLIKNSSTGTVLRNQTLSMRDFENLVVPFPDLRLQKRISKILGRVDSSSVIAGSQEQVLSALRASLVNAAFAHQL
jgi:type I restriction enzyme S subunit